RVRAARLEGHRVALPGRVHDRVRELVRALVQPDEDLDARTGARVRAGVAPRRDRGGGRGEERVRRGVRVADPELGPVRRALAAGRAVRARLVERELAPEACLEGCLPGRSAVLAVEGEVL